MTTTSAAKNVSGSPLVIDRAGHVLGAGAFGPVDVDAQPAKGHVDAKRLVIVERPTGDVELDEGAAAALDDAEAAAAEAAKQTKTKTKGADTAAPSQEA